MFLSVQGLLVTIGVNMIFLSLEAQRVNKNVKKHQKQQRRGGGGEEGEGRGVSSIIVSHIALLRMYFIVNFFLSVFVL